MSIYVQNDTHLFNRTLQRLPKVTDVPPLGCAFLA